MTIRSVLPRTFGFLLLLELTCRIAWPATPDDTATALAAAAGVKTGICAINRAGDGSLAVALAKNGFIVWAGETDPTKLAATRAALADSGLLGRSLYIEAARPGHLSLADCTVDLALITIGAATNLQTLPAEEVSRVLTPYNGVALIGPVTSANEAAVKTWATTLPGSTMKDAAGARWLFVRRGPLQGGSPWTHWFGAADNNPVTQDSAFNSPSEIAWLGKPYQLPRHVGCRVAGNGRVFIAVGASDNPNDLSRSKFNQIVARNVFNGTLLWRRPLDPKQRVLQSLMIADGDVLRLVEGPNILSLDAATGAEISRIAAGKEGEFSKWLGLSDGVLITLLGAEDPKDDGLHMLTEKMQKWRAERSLGYGKRFVATDAKTGKILWQHEEPDPVAARATAARDGKLYFLVPGHRLACLDIKTGKPVWENKDSAMLAGADEMVKDLGGVTVVAIEERPALLATESALFLGLADTQNFFCFSTKDGTQLWTSKRRGGRAFNFLVADNKLFLHGAEQDGALDPLTGKIAVDRLSFGGGCGVFTASANMILSQVGGATLALPNFEKIDPTPIKTQCQLGTFVSDGELLAVPAACKCVVGRGFLALAKASAVKEQSNPLECLVPDPKKVAPLPITAADWPTHRGNNNRTGATPVNPPATQPKELWTWKNPTPFATGTAADLTRPPEAAEFKPVPLVVVGDSIFLAAEDGSLRCLNAANGSAKWSARTDGPILATPTVADGRVFVGSADGRVYAFEAASGKLLWRYALAPSTDKTMIYGYLQSRWPVNSGVLVQDGIAYAAAGMVLQPGFRVVALDAATGAQKWLNTDGKWKEGKVWEMPADISLAGYMTTFAGKLWVRTFQGSAGGAAFDLTTGTLQDKIRVGGLRGREIGAIPGKGLVYGGCEIYRDRSDRTVSRGGIFSILAFGSDGKPVLPDMGNFHSASTVPAWTDSSMLNIGTKFAASYGDLNLECWDLGKTLAYVTEKAAGAGYEKMPDWRKNQMPEPRPATDIDNPTIRAWGPVKGAYVSVIIANKAVISVMANTDKRGEQPEGPWKLVAQGLQDGASLWELELPSQPAREAICIDRTGRIILCFDDGSVRSYGP